MHFFIARSYENKTVVSNQVDLNRESKHTKSRFFSTKKYDTYKCLICTEFCEVFTFLVENIYVQFEDRVYQQIVWVPYIGKSCAPLIADLLREGFYVKPSQI